MPQYCHIVKYCMFHTLLNFFFADFNCYSVHGEKPFQQTSGQILKENNLDSSNTN